MGYDARAGSCAVRVFVGLCVSSMLFGIVIAFVYWFVSGHEVIGTVLLGIMATALLFAACYACIAERNANLVGDDAEQNARAVAGEDLGIFTPSSAWPILCACAVLASLAGVLWVPFLAVVGIASLVLCLWRMGTESARVR
jgi:hypothetical protein